MNQINLKTINTLGTGYSGSSAIYEFFQKTNLFYDPFPNSNFSLTYDPGGLMDLEKVISNTFTINNSKIAHDNFQDLIGYYSKKNQGTQTGKDLIKHNKELGILLEQFLKSITVLNYKGDSGYLTYKNNFLKKMKIKFLLKFSKLIKKKMSNQQEFFLLSDLNTFENEVKKLFFELFIKDNNQKQDIILDQAGSIFAPKQSTKFFYNTFNICVLRDPRDIYAELKRKGQGFPGYDLKVFCEWYLIIMKKINQIKKTDERLIFINFEDFVLNRKSSLKKIFQFIENEFENFDEVQFDFKRSENNILIHKKELSDSENKFIENKLENHLFKF